MRIAFITYEFPPDTGKGGIGTYTNQLAYMLAKEGWDIHVFAGSHYREGKELEAGITIHRVECTGPHDFKLNVLPVFANEQTLQAFDIIESPEINGNAGEIKKKYPLLPLVVRLHAPDYLVESLKKKYVPFFAKLRYVLGAIKRLRFDLGFWKPYDKLADADYQFIQTADHITAPSKAMKQWAVSNWDIPANKIIIIPNIFLPSAALVNIPIEKENKYRRIIFFGRLNVLKGLVNATLAMKKILQEYPGWRFRVIGDDGPGPTNKITMRPWMKLKLKEVINRVEFMDGLAYEDLPAAISEGEIVLLPSLFESFSYTCAEAMAAGKAIAGSNNAGMAELLENGRSGLLINPYDYKEIIIAVKKLIEDNSLRYRLAVQAREKILYDFGAGKTAVKYVDLYEEIIEKRFAKN